MGSDKFSFETNIPCLLEWSWTLNTSKVYAHMKLCFIICLNCEQTTAPLPESVVLTCISFSDLHIKVENNAPLWRFFFCPTSIPSRENMIAGVANNRNGDFPQATHVAIPYGGAKLCSLQLSYIQPVQHILTIPYGGAKWFSLQCGHQINVKHHHDPWWTDCAVQS